MTNSIKQIIVFIGPEGSGKTTISKRVAKTSPKPYISTGDIIRKLAKHDQTRLGHACRDMFEKHTYLDHNLILDIYMDRFKKNDIKEGFILDGAMRSLEEVLKFQSILEKSSISFPVIIVYLQIPKEIGIERLLKRGRKDDMLEGITTRMSKYYEDLEERLAAIKKQRNWNLLKVDASEEIDEVFNKVWNALKEK